MLWSRWKKRNHVMRCGGDPAGVARAEEQLRISESLLRKAQAEIILPLQEMRERNNVTGLVRGWGEMVERQNRERGQ